MNKGDIITQKPYFRDVWGLGPTNVNYPGAFPRGLISRIKQKGWWGQKRLWLFSGSFKDPGGTTVDIKPEVKPDVVANCEQLPFEDESYDFVCLDPPYSEEESLRLYGMPYCNILKVMNEAARVSKSGGYVVLLHRLLPWHHPEENIHKKKAQNRGCGGNFYNCRIYEHAGFDGLEETGRFEKIYGDAMKTGETYPEWCVFWKEGGKFRFSREKTKKAVVGKLKILLDTGIFDPSEHIEIYPPNTVEVMKGKRDEASTTSS